MMTDGSGSLSGLLFIDVLDSKTLIVGANPQPARQPVEAINCAHIFVGHGDHVVARRQGVENYRKRQQDETDEDSFVHEFVPL
jgi:hypothetical protein